MERWDDDERQEVGREGDRTTRPEEGVPELPGAHQSAPEPYRQTAAALRRYFNHTAATVLDVEGSMRMWSDFADLWEEAAADGTAIGDIVGEDPVEFAETFAQAYTGKRWVDRERRLLNEAVARAQREQREQRR